MKLPLITWVLVAACLQAEAATESMPYELKALADFKVETSGNYVSAYADKNNQALAIDAAKHKNKAAAASTVFGKASGEYDVIITTLTETDGESTYQLRVGDRLIGAFQNPRTEDDYKPVQHRWKKVRVNQGDTLTVVFNTHSNGRTPEGDGFAFARGRWNTLALVAPEAPYALAEGEEPAFPDKDTSGYFSFSFDPAKSDRVYLESGGLLVVEAEHFALQTHDSVRKWYLTTLTQTPQQIQDGDGNHASSASGSAYVEILPDTRRNHSDPLIRNQNFCEDPGRMAVLYYPVFIQTPGRYYIWARVCPTGSEDNGLHVGLDGKWPGSGLRMQWIGKNSTWVWDSKQRTEKVHTGVKYRAYLDIKEPGFHTVTFSMREDGLEMDKWLISTNKDILVHGDAGSGPAESPLRKPAQ